MVYIRWPPRITIPKWLLLAVPLVAVLALGYLFADSVPSPPNVVRPAGKDTLKELIQGGRFSTITWDGLELGPPPGSSGGVVLDIYADEGARITVETLTVDGSACPKLTISDSEIHTLEVVDNATDGNSFGYSTTTLAEISVLSTRGMSYREHTDESFDWAYVDGGAGGVVKTMALTFNAFGGECRLSNLQVGTMTISNGRFGDGSGIDGTKTLVFETSTRVNMVTTSGNWETGVSVK